MLPFGFPLRPNCSNTNNKIWNIEFVFMLHLFIVFICHNENACRTTPKSVFSLLLLPASVSARAYVSVNKRMDRFISIESFISLTWEKEEWRDRQTKKWEGERAIGWGQKTSELASIMQFTTCKRRMKIYGWERARTWRPLHAVLHGTFFVALFVEKCVSFRE